MVHATGLDGINPALGAGPHEATPFKGRWMSRRLMADEDPDGIEDLFAKALVDKLVAEEELAALPPDEPESVADAFEIATAEPAPAPPGPPAADPLLTPLGPPATPPVDASPPGPPPSLTGPPASAPNQPEFAPPPGAFGAPPGPPPSDSPPSSPPGPPASPPSPPAAPPGPPAAPPGPPAAPPMDAVAPGPPSASPPGPPAAPPGPPEAPPEPPAAPPMDAAPPGPPSGPPPGPPAGPPTAPVDLSALDGVVEQVEEDVPPAPPAPPSMDVLLSPSPPGPPGPPAPSPESSTDHFGPPEALAPDEPTFERVDISAWDSNWNEDWSKKADVYAKDGPKEVPAPIQDNVEWDEDSDEAPVTTEKVGLPNEAALKKMKKPVLVELAKLRKVSSSGTKADIIGRLLG